MQREGWRSGVRPRPEPVDTRKDGGRLVYQVGRHVLTSYNEWQVNRAWDPTQADSTDESSPISWQGSRSLPEPAMARPVVTARGNHGVIDTH